MRRWLVFTAAGCCAVAFGFVAAVGLGPAGDPPVGGNVLVLLFDDAGVEKIGAYGHRFAARTPRIDGLAAEGIRFTRAYAAPVCSPTRAILLTGRHVRRTGVGWLVDTSGPDRTLPLEALTIPEMLQFATTPEPYANSAVGKWHLASPQHPRAVHHPNDAGFDWFAGTLINPDYRQGRGYRRWTRIENGRQSETSGYLTSATVDDALARIATMPEPWFLYVAFHAPHGPLNVPPSELLAQALPEGPLPREVRYDAVLEALDTEMGRLIDGIEPAVLERTTIFTLGDNGSSGAAFPEGEKGTPHKHSVREGGIRVPFIVTGPHVREPGRTSDALVHVADILPTVADIAGVPFEDERVLIAGEERVLLDGQSLLPLLADPAASGPEWVYAESFRRPEDNSDQRALVFREHKLIERRGTQSFFRLEGEDAMDRVDLLESGEPLVGPDADALARAREVLEQQIRPMHFEGR